MMSIPECPPLHTLPKTNTSHEIPEINMSTQQRYIGTEVAVTCPENYYVVGHEVIKCLDTLEWSTKSLPHCTDIIYGVPESTKLYIGVFSACALLVMVGLTIVIGRLACKHRKYERDEYMKGTVSVASMEYFPYDKRYRRDVTVPEADSISARMQTTYATDEHSDVMDRYRDQIIDFQNDAIEQNFETFINPSFCDDESTRDRWQRQMHGYDVDSVSQDQWQSTASSDRWQGRISGDYVDSVSQDQWQSPVSGYESSFDENSAIDQLDDVVYENTRVCWSAESVNALGDFDYDKYGRIPRAKSLNETPSNKSSSNGHFSNKYSSPFCAMK